MTWNGLNDAGSAVAPGTYLVQIQAKLTPASKQINYAVAPNHSYAVIFN